MTMAFDKASVRTTDIDGRLHVAMSNMSKATVNPYLGSEIPDSVALGLTPARVYYLLRDPDELARAAPSFNNLPILSEHVPVSADSHEGEIVIGSTGTDAAFEAPYLSNSAVIWVQDAIDDIESRRKCEWSCAYRYTADMTPGTFKGLRFDGIMRNIVGNHVALVEEGRAGPDIVVADSQPKGLGMIKSRKALMLQGAIMAYATPKLAMDATLDLTNLLSSVTASNLSGKKAVLAKAVTALVKGKLAQDEGLEVGEVVAIIEAVQGVEGDGEDVIADAYDDEDKPAMDDDDCVPAMLAFLQGKISEEDMAELVAMSGGDAPNSAPAMDENDDEDDDKDKPAMDAKLLRKQILSEASAIRTAEREVEPHIGVMRIALDSAAAVYKVALDAAKIDTAGVHPSAYRAMVAMLPSPDADAKPIAFDHASASTDFAKRFPNASKLRRS